MIGAAAGGLLAVATCALGLAVAAPSSPGMPPDDHRAYGRAVSAILADIENEDFAALERRYRDYLDPGARTTDGTWMLRSFQTAFDAKFDSEAPGRIERRFRNWKARDPRSSLRPIAEAFAWLKRASRAKGTECYPEVPSSARQAFNALVGRSAAALHEDDAQGTASPLWYTAAILVAGSQARPATELDALLDEADRRFPAYEPLYAARMQFLLPEWGGDFEAIDRFVRASARRTNALEGSAFYALLYVELAATAPCAHLFESSKVAWPEMKAGFEDLIKRHPGAWNKNVFATFACRARDVETTRRLLGELGTAASLGYASGSISNETCYRMVRPPVPRETISQARMARRS